MKGNELIEKILNKEIRSGALIKMTHNDGICKYCVTLTFNGNWFSEGKYNHDGVNERHNDIILYLCDEYATFELIEEDNKIEKIQKFYEYEGEITKEEKDKYFENIMKVYGDGEFEIDESMSYIIDKINEIIDKINKEQTNDND